MALSWSVFILEGLEKGHLSPTSIAAEPINIKEKDEYPITKFPISRLSKEQHM